MGDSKKVLQWIQHQGLENILWATDLDLTVLDAHKDPSQVKAPEGLEEAFRELDRLTKGKFFIITGRELSYVDEVFPKTKFKASAEYHNMVRYNPDEPHEEPNPQPQWDLINDKLSTLLGNFPGMTMREKPFMRSIHYSHADKLKNPNIKEFVKGAIQLVLDQYETKTGQALENIDGGSVFDIAPKGSNKGNAYNDAMLHVLESGAERPVPIYFGDSPGDIPAAAYVKSQGGIFVQIGDDPRLEPYADFKLDNTAECRDLIQSVIRNSPGPKLDNKLKGPHL